MSEVWHLAVLDGDKWLVVAVPYEGIGEAIERYDGPLGALRAIERVRELDVVAEAERLLAAERGEA